MQASSGTESSEFLVLWQQEATGVGWRVRGWGWVGGCGVVSVFHYGP